MEAILLAAGKGTRMRSERVKVLHPALGFPVLGYVLETLARLGVKRAGSLFIARDVPRFEFLDYIAIGERKLVYPAFTPDGDFKACR